MRARAICGQSGMTQPILNGITLVNNGSRLGAEYHRGQSISGLPPAACCRKGRELPDPEQFPLMRKNAIDDWQLKP